MGNCLSSPADPVVDCNKSNKHVVDAVTQQSPKNAQPPSGVKHKLLRPSVSGSTHTFSSNATSPNTSSCQHVVSEAPEELIELHVTDDFLYAPAEEEEEGPALGLPYDFLITQILMNSTAPRSLLLSCVNSFSSLPPPSVCPPHARPDAAPCESGRLDTIRSLAALNPSLLHSQVDAPPDPEVACILKLVASIFDAPAVLVALFDDKRIFVRDTEGNFERGDFPWRWSFCAWTLASQADSIMVIEDAQKDARFCDNAMVRGPAGIRFYCGAPLVASNGHRLGTLCIADQKPRAFDASSCQILNNMAELVVRHVERDIMLQLRKQDNTEMVKAYAQLQRTMDPSSQCVVLVDIKVQGWRVMYASEALTTVTGQSSGDFVGQLLSDLVILPSTTNSSSNSSTSSSSSSTSSAAKCPTAEHLRLAEMGTQFEISGVRLRAPQHGNSRTSHSSAHSHTSARSNASTGGHSYVLSLRPACQGDFDGDAMSIGIPSYVSRTNQPDKGGVVEPDRFFFLSIRRGRALNPRAQDSLTHSQAESLSSASVVFGDSIEGLVTGHLLGKGAFGSVYYGTWFGTPVAVKIVDQDIRAMQKKSMARMHADANNSEGTSLEAVLGQELQHPHIVSTLTYTIKTIDADAPPFPLPTAKPRPPSPPPGSAAAAAAAAAKLSHRLNAKQAMTAAAPPLQAATAVRGSAAHGAGAAAAGAVVGADGAVGGGGAAGVVDSFQCIDSFGASGNYFMINSDAGCEKAPVDELDDAEALGLKQYQSWIVMEYCDRGSLQDAVDKGWLRTERSTLSGAPNLPAILTTAHEIASAMCFLHSRGVIHGDLSAWNVLLSASGPSASAGGRGFVAKIADFGLARDLDVRTKIQTRTYGTLTHMPPETLSKGFISKATDIYSFGVLLWQMMTGSRPWSGQNHVQIVVLVAQRKRMLQFPAGTMPLYVQLAEACMAFDHAARPSFEECEARLSAMLEARPAE
ncbi:MAG: hypothetical protein WDW36_003011 [Sanguina aurantia]